MSHKNIRVGERIQSRVFCVNSDKPNLGAMVVGRLFESFGVVSSHETFSVEHSKNYAPFGGMTRRVYSC